MDAPRSPVEQFTSALVRFVEHDLLGGGSGRVQADTYLFDEGLIDSLKILRLIAFVEHWTGRPIPDADVVMSNFRSPNTIAERFVRAGDVRGATTSAS